MKNTISRSKNWARISCTTLTAAALMFGSIAAAIPATGADDAESTSSASNYGENVIRVDNSGVRPILDSIIVVDGGQGTLFDVSGLDSGTTAKAVKVGGKSKISLSATGHVIGNMAEAFAIDSNKVSIPTSYRVVNGALKQEIETTASTAYPVTISPAYLRTESPLDQAMVSTYRGLLVSPTEIVFPDKNRPEMASTQLVCVGIPSGYIYNTNMQPKQLHDYCTASPDSFGNANFKGSCAIHDMCIDKGRFVINSVQRKAARAGCDTGLGANLHISCGMANNTFTVGICRTVANTYYAAVSVATWTFG